MVKAFEQLAEDAVAKLSKTKNGRSSFEKLDSQIASVVVEQLGTDLYAHVAEEGPDDARRARRPLHRHHL